jgi:hypothetical protein
MINTLSEYPNPSRFADEIILLDKILHDLTDEDEVFTPFDGEQKSPPDHQHDLELIYQSIEEKIAKIENKLKNTSLHTEQNQRHLHLLARLKEKFYKNISNKKD